MVCHDTRASSRVLPIRRPWPREPLRGGESRPELWVQSAPGSQKQPEETAHSTWVTYVSDPRQCLMAHTGQVTCTVHVTY